MYLYGKNVALELLKESNNIEIIYLYKEFSDNFIKNKIALEKIKVIYKDKREMDNIVEGNHQGIIIKIKKYQYTPLNKLLDKSFIVILDHIEDPHNFGAIIRSCEAANVDGIIIPKDRSVSVNGTVFKVSVGTVAKTKIAQVVNLKRTIDELKKNGFWIVGTDMQGTDYKQIDYQGKIALVIGNEGKGLSELVKKSCDFMASIPMYGHVNSLNASVAAAIIILEAAYQRK